MPFNLAQAEILSHDVSVRMVEPERVVPIYSTEPQRIQPRTVEVLSLPVAPATQPALNAPTTLEENGEKHVIFNMSGAASSEAALPKAASPEGDFPEVEFQEVKFPDGVSPEAGLPEGALPGNASLEASSANQVLPLALPQKSKELIYQISTMDVFALSEFARFLPVPAPGPASAGSAFSTYPFSAPAPTPAGWNSILASASAASGLDQALLSAVIRVESNFQPQALSPRGAQGAMQIMPQTQVYLGLTDPLDPAANVHAGARYLKEQWLRFGSLELALAAYNAGPGAVLKYGGVPPYAETEAYVQRVLSYYNYLN